MPYNRGVYARIGKSKITPPVESQTVLVAVGTAPVHQLENPQVNKIMKIQDYLDDITTQVGFSNDFGSFTLSEVHEAVFNLIAVTPAYYINILNPDIHRKAEPVTKTLSFVKGKALLPDDKAILTTIDLEDRTRGVDYDVAYDRDLDAYVFALRAEMDAGGTQEFKQLDNAAVAEQLATAGVTFEDGLINYEPTGNVPAELYHNDLAYIPVTFPTPQGAKLVDVKITGSASGQVIEHTGIDLENGNLEDDSVIDGNYVLYLAFADKEGNRLKKNDYTVEFTWYDENGDKTKTYSIIKRTPAKTVRTGTLDVTYTQVNPDAVTVDDFIGDEDEWGERTGLSVMKNLEEQFGVQATDLIAPGFSHIPECYQAMMKVTPLNNHWLVFVHADIPVDYKVQTRAQALQWKDDNEYEEEGSKVYWPQCVCEDGKVYHLSTVAVAVQMRTDIENGDLPYVSASNRETPIISQYFGEGSKNNGFDNDTANELTEYGITTTCYHAGGFKIWGTHTAAFSYFGDNDPRSDHDTQMRMIYYLVNGFQKRQMERLDLPMSRDIKDAILIEEQQNLDRLVSQGALYGQPRIYFDEKKNTIGTVLKGEFYFQLDAAPALPLIYINATVSYDDSGYYSLYRQLMGEE